MEKVTRTVAEVPYTAKSRILQHMYTVQRVVSEVLCANELTFSYNTRILCSFLYMKQREYLELPSCVWEEHVSSTVANDCQACNT